MKSLSPNQNKVHFIGIGGIGTSALARWFLSRKYIVSGSDASSSEITSELKKQGIKIFIGHKAKNLPHGANLAIFSAAVASDNPEIKEAKKLGIPVKSYAEFIGGLTRQYKTLAVSGAHGKSTTTALLSLVLIKAGFDPTVIIGAKLKEFGNSNFRPACRRGRQGKGNYLVLEADEYNASFLNYSPFAAIILNIDREHLDYYKNLANVKKSFLKFIGNIQSGGILILNKDDKNLFGLKNKIQKITKKKKIRVFWHSLNSNVQIYQRLSTSLKILGKHNVSNALAVYTLAKTLDIKEKNIFDAISRYRGAWRRMEYRGNLKFKIQNLKFKIPVYDDYAHHPTEIKATLAGIARKSPKTALICVFQPHQAKRLSLLFKDFIGAFDKANVLILLDIFKVAGRDSVAKYHSSKELADAINRHLSKSKNIGLKKVIYFPRPGGARLASLGAAHPKRLRKVLTDLIIRNSHNSHSLNFSHYIIVMMGAGDIYKLTDKLIE